jgi:hypothetical protein
VLQQAAPDYFAILNFKWVMWGELTARSQVSSMGVGGALNL